MTEAEAVKATPGMPATTESIRTDLATLGVSEGTVLLVHSSLSSMGWVCGGPVAVVLALEAAIGPEGTLVMPAYSSDLSEPSDWRDPPVPESWWETIRQSMPAFDVKMTPTRRVGAIPDCFRSQAGTVRSLHPADSFSARGPRARMIIDNHSLNYPMGDSSPLARIYDLDGSVLLLGATYECASSLHLAEYRAEYPKKKLQKRGAPVELEGRRMWIDYSDFDTNPSDFTAIGSSFAEKTGLVRSGRVANARAQLFPQRQFVDFAVKWLEENCR